MKYPYKQSNGKFGSAIVENLPELNDLAFCSDSQETEAIKEYIGQKAQEFDSFFVLVGDGDYDAVWGMFGTVPYLGKRPYRIV